MTVVLDIMVAIAAATLAGMGVGGGGLLVLYLTLIKNTEQFTAQEINLLFFLCAASASMILHWKKRTFLPSVVLLFGLSGTLSSLVGYYTASTLQPQRLQTFFGYFLIFSGLYTLWEILRKKHKTKQ